MVVRTIYADETGFTGGDLLNREQPIFAIATTDLADEAAGNLLRTAFPNYQGDEFKFSNIWPRPKSKRRVVGFGELIGKQADNVFSYFIDKRFCALTKVVDFLVEPLAHDAGFDFYAQQFARRYTNMFHYGLVMFGEPELYERIVRLYQSFVRAPTRETLKAMEISYGLMASSGPIELREFLSMAARGAATFLRFHELEAHRGSNDIQFTALLASIGDWRGRVTEDLAIIHDQSSNFFRREEAWSAMTNSDIPEQLHQAAGDSSFIQYPLRVVRTEAVDSRNSFSVQLCDVLAGLVARGLRRDLTPEDAALMADVNATGFGELRCNGIRPEPEFPIGEAQPLEGPDSVDQALAIMKAGMSIKR